jgi:hypothetical protein
MVYKQAWSIKNYRYVWDISDMYSKEISKLDTSFHQFGRRNYEGWPMRTPGIRGDLPWTKIQLEDMESHAFNLEHLLCIEMDATDDAKQLLQERE